jgi:hypothetical protein
MLFASSGLPILWAAMATASMHEKRSLSLSDFG